MESNTSPNQESTTSSPHESKTSSSQGFDLKSAIVKVTGVLVVIPALLNGVVDIYSVIAKLPKTDSEKLNLELFKKYFNKQPVAAFPIPIKQNNGTVEVRFQVFDEGDVFIEFGNYTQWFPFPKTSLNRVGWLPIKQAVAQDVRPSRGFGHFTQKETINNGIITRERRWENGVLESTQIDARTGEIVGKNISRWAPDDARANRAASVSQLAPIDLDAARAARIRPTVPSSKQSELTSTCSTPSGPCKMVNPLPVGSHCACYGAQGGVSGTAK